MNSQTDIPAIEAVRAQDRADLSRALRKLRGNEGHSPLSTALVLGGFGLGCLLLARQPVRQKMKVEDDLVVNGGVLLAGAAAFGTGAVAARAFPVTRIEDRLLGDVGDAMRSQAADLWEREATWAYALAETAADAVIDGAEEGAALTVRRSTAVISATADAIASRISRK